MARCARAASSSGAVMTPQPTTKNAGRGAQKHKLNLWPKRAYTPKGGAAGCDAHCSEQAVDCTVTCVLEDLQLLCHFIIHCTTIQDWLVWNVQLLVSRVYNKWFLLVSKDLHTIKSGYILSGCIWCYIHELFVALSHLSLLFYFLLLSWIEWNVNTVFTAPRPDPPVNLRGLE